VTDDEDALVDELTPAEVATLPDKYFVRVAVCRHTGDEGQVVESVEYADLDATVPDGWTCALVANKVPRLLLSYRPLRSVLVDRLQEKCCAGCEAGESCAVRPGSWGACPYCLLDDTCNQLCNPAPSEP
jgi:hypothetical protein